MLVKKIKKNKKKNQLLLPVTLFEFQTVAELNSILHDLEEES